MTHYYPDCTALGCDQCLCYVCDTHIGRCSGFAHHQGAVPGAPKWDLLRDEVRTRPPVIVGQKYVRFHLVLDMRLKGKYHGSDVRYTNSHQPKDVFASHHFGCIPRLVLMWAEGNKKGALLSLYALSPTVLELRDPFRPELSTVDIQNVHPAFQHKHLMMSVKATRTSDDTMRFTISILFRSEKRYKMLGQLESVLQYAVLTSRLAWGDGLPTLVSFSTNRDLLMLGDASLDWVSLRDAMAADAGCIVVGVASPQSKGAAFSLNTRLHCLSVVGDAPTPKRGGVVLGPGGSETLRRFVLADGSTSTLVLVSSKEDIEAWRLAGAAIYHGPRRMWPVTNGCVVTTYTIWRVEHLSTRADRLVFVSPPKQMSAHATLIRSTSTLWFDVPCTKAVRPSDLRPYLTWFDHIPLNRDDYWRDIMAYWKRGKQIPPYPRHMIEQLCKK